MISSDVANPTIILTALLKHIKARREAINARWPKHLRPEDYQKLVGNHEELETLETVMNAAWDRANRASEPTNGDDT